jgi:plasmid stability protein
LISEVVVMADVLVRNVPEDVLAGVDAHAARLGLSRVEYIRRRLAADAATTAEEVSTGDLRSFADLAADLADPQVMGAAWQ